MDYVKFLSSRGWVASKSVAEKLTECGIPVPDPDYLTQAFGASVWDEVVDVRCVLSERIRKSQSEITTPDFVDER